MAAHTTSTFTMAKARGTHQFNINGYSTKIFYFRIRSGTFTIGGYDWCIIYYPNSRSIHDDGEDYIEVNLELLNVDEVRVLVKLSLIDQTTNKPHTIILEDEPVTLSRTNVWGVRKFMKRSELDSSAFVRDNCLIIECELTVINLPNAIPKTTPFCNINVPPPEMAVQFGNLLEGMEGADVTFEVTLERRPLLPIGWCLPPGLRFSRHIYLDLRRTGGYTIYIRIREMQPAVFKDVLLHYIYTESLPTMGDVDSTHRNEMVRHLLEAADQYAVESWLKIMCERMLWMDLDVENVATTLALADQHHCHKLKKACLEFMEPSERMDAVVGTQRV